MPKLHLTLPGRGPLALDLNEGRNILGRTADNDLRVDHGSVSSHHAELHLEGATVTLRDLGSTNGTFLNGQPVGDTPVPVAPRDTLQFGQITAALAPESPALAASAGTLPAPAAPADEPHRNTSARPADFRSLSPFQKQVVEGSQRDPLALVAIIAAALGVLLFAAAVFTVQTLVLPA